MRFALTSLFAVVLMGVLAMPAAAEEQKAKVGEKAPNFTLKDQSGNEVSLSDFAGKIVVLEMFNEQCPFVVKHYREGHMNALANKYKEQGVVWLAINPTYGSTIESNKAIAEKWNIDRPILHDAESKVAKLYRATNTPHMYVIDQEGTLRYMGAIDSNRSAKTEDIDGATNYVDQALQALLSGSEISTPETKAYGCTIKFPPN